ncbi:uncharacterized protein LOC144092349 [Stigmatopora argus]
MAHLPMASSSPHVECPERDEGRGAVSAGGNTSDVKRYLYEEFFPDITLLELTNDQTMDNVFLPSIISPMPLSARTTPSPRIEVNKTNFNQARNLNTNVSTSWLEDVSFPEMANSFNSTVNRSTSKIEPTESNLDSVATLTVGAADKSSTCSPEIVSPMTRPQNEEHALPTGNEKGPTSEIEPTEQASLEAQPPCQLSETITLSKSISNAAHHNTLDGNNTFSPSGTVKTGSRPGNCLYNTFDANPPSNSASSISEHDSNNIHHNTIETEPPSGSSGTTVILDTNSSNCLQKTLDTNLPPQLNNNLTMSEIKDSSKTNPPTQNNGTIIMSDSCTSDSHLNEVIYDDSVDIGQNLMASTPVTLSKMDSFFAKPVAKPSLLPRYKPTASRPGRSGLAATGVPSMKGKVPTPTEGSGSSSSNLRPSTAATQLPKSRLERLVNSQKRTRDISRDAQSIVKRPKIDVPTSSRPTVSGARGAIAQTKSLKLPLMGQGSQLAKATQGIPAKRQDEDEAFLLSLLPRMKKIKQEKKPLLRSAFLKVLNDAEG